MTYDKHQPSGKTISLGILIVFFALVLAPLLAFANTDRLYLEKAMPFAGSVNSAMENLGYPKTGYRHLIFGQIEQETCSGPKSKQCWNPRAELKTYREYGFNFGQFTIAYTEGGKERFNVFEELRTRYKKELSGWTWENRFDPYYGVTAMLLKSRSDYAKVTFAATEQDRMNITNSTYNGGYGDILVRRRACMRQTACDPTRWYGHLELHSGKSRQPVKGYKLSWAEINNTYVSNIERIRAPKYRALLTVKPKSTT
jgi:hypothetical protein